MLLTVIAVATLLVAVVGATFAYFSLSLTGSATTDAKVSTGTIGLVQIASTTDSLTLNVTPQDMAKPEGGKDEYYYAVKEASSHTQPTGGIWEKQEAGSGSAPQGTTAILANVTRTGGGENDTYTCGYKVTITVAQGKDDDLKKFSDGNLFLTVTGDGITESDSAEDTTSSNVTISDFSDFNGSKVLHGKVKLDSDTEELGDELVNATLYLVNSYNNDQSAGEGSIAGLDVTLNFKVEPEGTCTIESKQAVE